MQLTSGAGLAISIVLATAAGAQTATDPIEATGAFRPAAAPENRVSSPIGNRCVIDLEQGYLVDGTLSGTLRVSCSHLHSRPLWSAAWDLR